jgi:nitroimidazol reductase NimA-like FMN-containing flavoprotein (pyridoxamine 5'-phosphate oxidase superfamily)
MRELRRNDRAITNDEAIAILNKAEYGVLSTVTPDGKPYGVPLNFCIIDHCIYFHCAIEGQKIDNIEKNKSVSFCVVGDNEILPDKFGTKYESVIISGEVEEIFDGNKQIALEGMLKKYSSNYFEKGLKYIETLKTKTRGFKISIIHLSGKARRQ